MPDFNQYSENYAEHINKAIGFAGASHDFYLKKKTDYLIKTTRARLGDSSKLSLLDVGCGIGLMERFLCDDFGYVHGVDIAEAEVEVARRNAPRATFEPYRGPRLPFDDGRFDVAFACCVLHHVPPAEWNSLCAEMARVIKPGGLAFIFEHNPLNPLTRLSVSKNEFDNDAVLLGRGRSAGLLKRAGLRVVAKPYIIFFPWKSRVLAGIESCLRWLPLGAQYAVVAVR